MSDRSVYPTTLRETYVQFHELLSGEIESNGFRNEHEAISFVSSLFSHAMSAEFLTACSDVASRMYHDKNKGAFIVEAETLIDDLTHNVREDAKSIGVHGKFLQYFYGKNNVKSRADFSEMIKALDILKIQSEEKARKEVFRVIYAYLKDSVGDSKRTYYLEVDSDLLLKVSVSIIAGGTLMYAMYLSKAHFLLWLR